MPAMIAVSPEVASWDAATSVGTSLRKGRVICTCFALMSGSCCNKTEVHWCDKMMLCMSLKKIIQERFISRIKYLMADSIHVCRFLIEWICH